MGDAVISNEFIHRLRAFIRRRVLSDAVADDILQDTLLKFVQHQDSISSEGGPAWVFTVARRVISDHFRRRSPETIGIVEPQLQADDEESASALTEMSQCVEPLLAQLRPEDRALLQRVDLHQEPQADLADAMGIPRSTLKARVQRARKRFRSKLADCCVLTTDTQGMLVDFEPKSAGECQGSAKSCTSRDNDGVSYVGRRLPPPMLG
jgi:RNA polymerase sigma-70 factor, ECF subfamily